MNELKVRLARKHFERGRAFEVQDKLDEAVDCYRQAVALSPDFAAPYFGLGRAEALLGQFGSALRALERARDFGPDAEVSEWLGYTLGRLRLYDRALAAYQEAMDPDDPNLRVNAARMMLALGQWSEVEALLSGVDDPAALALLDGLPRYQEFQPPGIGPISPPRDPLDEPRALRYVAAGTLVLGTLGDGGLAMNGPGYVLLSMRHVAVTVRRLMRLIRERRWAFDAVVGSGPAHAPVAIALSTLLEVPHATEVAPDARVLVASAVVHGPEESLNLMRPWTKRPGKTLHFALGYTSEADATPDEPELVGHAGRCAVEWYRVESWSRMRIVEVLFSRRKPELADFEVGPPFVDPNSGRVAAAIVEAVQRSRSDPPIVAVLDWYRRHPQTRAFANEPIRHVDA